MKREFSGKAGRNALAVFGGVNLLIGAGFWVWNPDPPALVRVPGHPVANVAASSSPLIGADSAAIIHANIFSSSRRPPLQRYNPAEDLLDSPAETSSPVAEEQGSPPPQLFGTVLGPSGAMALMQSDSLGGPGRLYREGDKIGAYRLLKVKSSSVIVTGPSGRLEIHVQRSSTGS